jgi:dihydrofolate reductase
MKRNYELAMIVAADLDKGIGRDNDMPWHISADLKRFKELTTGHSIVMGRKTWESLPKKPLPKRENIVLTRNRDFSAEGATVIHSIEDLDNLNLNGEVFIIGGAEVYNLFYSEVSTLYLTYVMERFDCDTYLEFLKLKDWETIHESEVLTDEKSGTTFQFIDMKRKN